VADTLFDTVARWHDGRRWGRLLDAGTGAHSLEWCLARGADAVVAVTGDPAREAALRQSFGPRLSPGGRVVCGNWQDPAFLAGEHFDVVLADYLLGAIDGFAPYFQPQLFGRLRRHLAPGGVLYAIGLAPLPDAGGGPGADLIREIARLRDACILLAGHRCYREYPLDWVLRSLDGAGLEVEDAVEIDIVWGARWVEGQLAVCRAKLPLLADRALAASLDGTVADLRERALRAVEQERGIRLGADWVVKARVRA